MICSNAVIQCVKKKLLFNSHYGFYVYEEKCTLAMHYENLFAKVIEYCSCCCGTCILCKTKKPIQYKGIIL